MKGFLLKTEREYTWWVVHYDYTILSYHWHPATNLPTDPKEMDVEFELEEGIEYPEEFTNTKSTKYAKII